MRLRESLAPWAGIIAGPLVWWIHQRSVADAQFFECHAHGLAGRIVWSLVLIAALAWATSLSWRLWREAPNKEAEPDVHRFIALVSLGVAGIVGLAVVFGTLASVIVPDCYR